jgi:hypothetical protein
MSQEWILWVLFAAAAMHVVEEHALGWQGWAARYIGPRIGVIPTWTDFWATNMLLLAFGFSAAVVGWWSAPAYALAFPALCLINAVFFHIVPSLQANRPNPGLFTAVLLYLPISIWAYVAASDESSLDPGTFLLSVLIGAGAMISVLVILVLGARLGYEDVDPDADPSSLESASSSTSSAPR